MKQANIKNVIFDLGGVLFDWNPALLQSLAFPAPADRAKVRKHFMDHPRWADMDRGIKETDLVLEEAAMASGLKKRDLRNMLDKVPKVLTLKEGTAKIIARLKNRNLKLFVLSNMPRETWIYLNTNFPVFELFDGKVASCNVGMIKPEFGIYKYILDTFCLQPKESLFIDDLEINIKAAEKLGIHGIVFQDPDALEKELNKLGCLKTL